MNNQKGFSPIIILIIIALLGGGILAWQQLGVPKEEVETPEEKVIEDETADYLDEKAAEYSAHGVADNIVLIP